MKKLNILVACEYSGAVRQRLRDLGHNAISCDLLPADDGSPYHYTGDMWDLIEGTTFQTKAIHSDGLVALGMAIGNWDVLVAFPPCTYLTVSGAWLFADRSDIKRKVADDVLTGAARKRARNDATWCFIRLASCGIPKIYIENPSRSFVCTSWRGPDQVVHPYQFGDDASKSTGFWIVGGEHLKVPAESDWVAPRYVESAKTGKMLPRWGNQTDSGQNCEPPGALRWKIRSDTWPGIADALVAAILS